MIFFELFKLPPFCGSSTFPRERRSRFQPDMPASVQQYIAEQIRTLEEAERKSAVEDVESKPVEPFTPRRSRASLGRPFERRRSSTTAAEHVRLLPLLASRRCCRAAPSRSVIASRPLSRVAYSFVPSASAPLSLSFPGG